MAFRDLDEFLVTKPIELPIRGKTYSFPGAIPARSGLMLHRLTELARKAAQGVDRDALAAEVLSDNEEADLRAEILGDAEVEMAADGLTTAHVAHVFRVLLLWHIHGQEVAERAWEAMADPPAQNREARRAAARSTRPAASRTTSSRQKAKPERG